MPVQQIGVVMTGRQPVAGALVTLHAASTDVAVPATELGWSVTDAQGGFTISYTQQAEPGRGRYLIAEGPRPGIRLASLLGLATVASAAAQ